MIDKIPSPLEIHNWIGHLLRELHVARRMMKIAELAEEYRQIERQSDQSKKEG